MAGLDLRTPFWRFLVAGLLVPVELTLVFVLRAPNTLADPLNNLAALAAATLVGFTAYRFPQRAWLAGILTGFASGLATGLVLVGGTEWFTCARETCLDNGQLVNVPAIWSVLGVIVFGLAALIGMASGLTGKQTAPA